MKNPIVFDLDETLDHPAILRLCQILYDVGVSVAVLSGSHTAKPYSTEAHKRQQLRVLGLPDDLPLIVAQGDTDSEIADRKARWLQTVQASLFIDDRGDFISKARAVSPDLVALHVIGPRARRSVHAVRKLQT